MSRTELYDRHIILDDFMRNSNFGIGVLHVSQILTYFCDVTSLLAQVFIVSSNRVS